MHTVLITKAKDIGINILLVIITIAVIHFIIKILIEKVYIPRMKVRSDRKERMKQRLKTFLQVSSNVSVTLAIALSVLIILTNFFNLTGFIAGAGISVGIIGIGLSLGVQPLVKDILTGIFFLLQDQFGVGDVIQIAGFPPTIGTVTSVTIRNLTVRDFSGNVTTFPNGNITQVTNLSKQWSIFDYTFTMPSTLNVDEMIKLMKEAGDSVESDDNLNKFLLDKTEILGIENLGGGNMQLRVNIKTLPGYQFQVGREYRYRFKKILEEKNISI